MGKKYKKTLAGSIIAFVLGTSCCWVSSIAIWIGGTAVFGVISTYLLSVQVILIAIGVILGLLSVYLYRKAKA